MALLQSTFSLLPSSITSHMDVEYALTQTYAGLRLAVCGPKESGAIPQFNGECSELDGRTLVLCPLTAENAAILRTQLLWLQPRPLGLKTSVGLGDRIGLSTPGHVRAVRAFEGRVMPIFAQQSIREMGRTERTPRQVMDDAT